MAMVFVRQANYQYDQLREVFFDLMEAIGADRIRSGSRVLIKPNLLCPASPRQAVLTHPLIIRAAVEYVLEKGATPSILDSPAMGSFAKILKDNGIREALRDWNIECRPFEKSVKVDIGAPFGAIEIAEEALQADVIISLPKLKTHDLMLLTLGVKNMFGCIVGYRKPEWHMRAGIDRVMFARLLVQIYERIRPAVTILDGILALEGHGPGKGGTPKEIGVLMGSRDAHALDAAVCRMIGLSPDHMATLNIARTMGLQSESVDIDGVLPRIRDFKLPETGQMIMGPKFLHGIVRRHLLPRPVVDQGLCKLCGECGEICPAQAISQEGKTLRFDYDRCIRCYCCIEVCPFAALQPVETVPGRFIRNIVKKHF